MLKILAIIPARGGSKSIPLKNLYLLNRKPLIQYTIESAILSNIFTKIIVSSDNKKILNFSNKFKSITAIKRPKKYARDLSSTDSVVESVLNYELKKNFYDYLCIIEPTSPLRSSKSLIKAYKFLSKKKVDSNNC